jgi:hypothetical protein
MSNIRICELLPGDIFEIGGLDYEVERIGEGFVHYRKRGWNWNGRKYMSGHHLTFGEKSQQFVNLVSHAGNGDIKKRV